MFDHRPRVQRACGHITPKSDSRPQTWHRGGYGGRSRKRQSRSRARRTTTMDEDDGNGWHSGDYNGDGGGGSGGVGAAAWGGGLEGTTVAALEAGAVLPPSRTRTSCDHCGTVESPQWRKGPPNKPVLCNACGARFLRHRKLTGGSSGDEAAATAAAPGAPQGALGGADILMLLAAGAAKGGKGGKGGGKGDLGMEEEEAGRWEEEDHGRADVTLTLPHRKRAKFAAAEHERRVRGGGGGGESTTGKGGAGSGEEATTSSARGRNSRSSCRGGDELGDGGKGKGKGMGRKGKADTAVNALLAATKCAEAARRRMLPSRGGGKQKMHRPWSLPEVQALVDGVARFGRGQWADIKALQEGGVSRPCFSSLLYWVTDALKAEP
jgi:hypothetical protein